ncbi:DUF3103 family protein [Streptomyces verrucosisporus]|uniref:DUF3103 family protein n=1 Tax=Streptomyces verrucosisporus TaxID=1695161 RepID=UPI0019CFB7EC|nr:DUF3103 family protein [Streptomyces verrucosisporus]MBN3932097.1 DUF3103 family protein [Streptomyces verrucosisporus]
MVRHRFRNTVVCAALLSLGLGCVQGVASASPPPDTSRGSATVTAIEDSTARSLAASLSDPAWQARIEEAALASDGVGLGGLAGKASSPAAKDFGSVVADADRDLAAAKGLGTKAGPLLRLRLADESMREALKAGAEPLVAVAPADDSAATVTAYDSAGRTHTLDAHRLPERPVYVVGVDAERAVTAGMAVLREELARHGLSTAGPVDSASTASDGFWTSRITSVRLSDDEEPWIKGDAEIFSLVTGFGPDGKVRVDPVDMPYLDEDGRTYQPNQILVNWSYYKYNLADVVMMEEDSGTNYRSLAKALADALLTIIDMGAHIPLVNAVLDAMPDHWWTDDPDYVDSWYTLARNSAGSFRGARGNGTMTLEPYWVSAF